MHQQPVAVVTGGSRGIGRGMAIKLAECGYAVVVNFLRSESQATAVASAIEDAGGVAEVVQADVGVAEDRCRLLDSCCDRFGRLDLLINNAGVAPAERVDLLETTEASWEQVFSTNLKGPFFLAQQAARSMIQQIEADEISRGKIINVSSISAYAGSLDRGTTAWRRQQWG